MDHDRDPAAPLPSRGRGIYLLPNLFTTGGLFAGFFAIIAASQGRFGAACVAIFVAGILDGIDDIAFCNLTSRDVVRHRLVGKIVAAYDRYDIVTEPYGAKNPRKNRKTR